MNSGRRAHMHIRRPGSCICNIASNRMFYTQTHMQTLAMFLSRFDGRIRSIPGNDSMLDETMRAHPLLADLDGVRCATVYKG